MMKLLVAVLLLAAALINAAPTPRDIEEELRQLNQKIDSYGLQQRLKNENQFAPLKESYMGFVPQKRMVAWQPMKRGLEDSRTPLLHAIEARLAEVLRAGERLGINPEEVLQDLRSKNQFQ